MTRRCSRCILPDSLPGISFNYSGVCNYCYADQNIPKKTVEYWHLKEKSFFEEIDAARKKQLARRLPFRILVPLSGGRDSSFVAWYIAKKLNIEIVCANYANPYSSAQAVENVRHLVSKIDARLVQFSYPHRMHEINFEKNLKNWILHPDLSTFGLICLACKPMYLKFYEIARREKINLMIDGSNVFEVTSFKVEAQGQPGFKNFMNKILRNRHCLRLYNLIPGFRTFFSLN